MVVATAQRILVEPPTFATRKHSSLEHAYAERLFLPYTEISQHAAEWLKDNGGSIALSRIKEILSWVNGSLDPKMRKAGEEVCGFISMKLLSPEKQVEFLLSATNEERRNIASEVLRKYGDEKTGERIEALLAERGDLLQPDIRMNAAQVLVEISSRCTKFADDPMGKMRSLDIISRNLSRKRRATPPLGAAALTRRCR